MPHPFVIELTDDTFDREVTAAPGLVMVDFYTPHCPPCRQLAPVIDELAKEFSGRIKVCKLNAELNTRTAIKFRLQQVPHVMIFRDGAPIGSIVGFLTKKHFVEQLERLAG